MPRIPARQAVHRAQRDRR